MADYTVRELATAAYRAGFRGPALATAVAIALAEDTARSLHAVNHNSNGTVDRGPWQINSATQKDIGGAGLNPSNLQDSAKLAFMVYQKQGFPAWTTYNSGKYRLFIRHASRASIHAQSQGDTLITLPGDAQQQAVGGAVRTAGEGVINAATAVPSLIGHLLSPEFWKMVGVGLLATALIIIGAVVMLESNKNVRSATVKAAAAA